MQLVPHNYTHKVLILPFFTLSVLFICEDTMYEYGIDNSP